jgi:hypothetical protein
MKEGMKRLPHHAEDRQFPSRLPLVFLFQGAGRLLSPWIRLEIGSISGKDLSKDPKQKLLLKVAL